MLRGFIRWKYIVCTTIKGQNEIQISAKHVLYGFYVFNSTILFLEAYNWNISNIKTFKNSLLVKQQIGFATYEKSNFLVLRLLCSLNK